VTLSPRPEDAPGLMLESGTRSLILQFPSGTDEAPEPVSIGAVIATEDGLPLESGTCDRQVRLTFWSDEARIYAHSGAPFEIWYGHPVGHGVVIRTIDDFE